MNSNAIDSAYAVSKAIAGDVLKFADREPRVETIFNDILTVFRCEAARGAMFQVSLKIDGAVIESCYVAVLLDKEADTFRALYTFDSEFLRKLSGTVS